MAEALTVVGIAVNKLSTFLIDEGRLLGGLRQEVQLIHDEFGHMKAFLEKAADSDDPQLTEWISQVRQVSYTTRDILDKFNLHFAVYHAPGLNIQRAFRSVQNLWVRRQLASKLQGLKARIQHISEARRRYECDHYTNVVPQIQPWRHNRDDDALLVEEADLVGIDEQRRHLISRLLNAPDSQLKVMAVLGMGGVGKTTLVRKVYDDFEVKYHFHVRAWVTVSQTCDPRGLLTGLIQQIVAQFNEPVPARMESMDVYQLKALVKDFLGRGRYVIVFDDVWDTEFWDAFKFVLPENDYSGNHVMLTTRIAGVALASTLECQGYVHRMGCLSSQNSWILFCNKIFKGKQCPDHLIEVAKSIVEKCGGLPLAIVAIGGLMASKDLSRINEWERVQSRLRDEFQKTGRLGRVSAILSLSYNDLPWRLQTCLLYTCIYSRVSNIPCRHLIPLLVAEGFVEEKEGQAAEEIAVDYLNELANRSLIQLNEVRYDGSYSFLNIHDLWGEFLACKSREQNMMSVVSTEHQIEQVLHPRVAVRRLVLDYSFPDISSLDSHSYCHVQNLRSIIVFGEKPSPSKSALAKLLSSKLLTVLDFRSVELECIPKEVFNLFHLKYLALRGNKITKLSKSIQRLTKLEYLNLRHTNVRKLPMEIHNLHNLRYLRVMGFRAPSGMKKLVELQKIYAIDVANSDGTVVSEIGTLAKLRALYVTNVRTKDGIELCSSIEKLNNLQHLSIYSSVEDDEAISLDLDHSVSALSLPSLCQLRLFGRLQKFPSWVKNVQGLKLLKLIYSNLSEDPLENIQHLPHLSELHLTQTYQGESLSFRAGGFLKLRKMLLGSMKAFKYLRIEEGAMPALSILTLDRIPLLENLPLGIEHLRQLQRLNLWDVNSELIHKLENADDSGEENEDYRNKIAHIPRVAIGFRIDRRLKTHWLSRKKKIEVDYGFPLPPDGVHHVPDTARGFGFGTLLFLVLFISISLGFMYPLAS